jgi:hypothetical protein
VLLALWFQRASDANAPPHHLANTDCQTELW